MNLEKELKREHADNNPLVQLLREIKYGSAKNNLPLVSALDNQIVKLETDPDLAEAFYLGSLLTSQGQLGGSVSSMLEDLTNRRITEREWEILNKNILTLTEATSIPVSLKKNNVGLDNLFELIDIYHPKKFFPKVHQMKEIVSELKIETLDDVIKFNHQFKIIFNYLIDIIKESKLMDAVRHVNLQDLLTAKKSIRETVTKADKIYSKQFDGKRFISLDIRQANSTTFFVHYGRELFKKRGLEISDMGLDLDKYFGSWDEFFADFNWHHFVKITLKLRITLKPSADTYPFDIVTDIQTVNILCTAFMNSKLTREIIMGVNQRIQLHKQVHTFGRLFEVTCNLLMNELLNYLSDRIDGMEIVSFSTDEIIMRLPDDKTLTDISEMVAQAPSESIIGTWFKNFLKIEEYQLKAFELPNKRVFYAKLVDGEPGTNPSVSIKLLDPENKINGMKMIEEYIENR
jgi:hypothetical protein